MVKQALFQKTLSKHRVYHITLNKSLVTKVPCRLLASEGINAIAFKHGHLNPEVGPGLVASNCCLLLCWCLV